MTIFYIPNNGFGSCDFWSTAPARSFSADWNHPTVLKICCLKRNTTNTSDEKKACFVLTLRPTDADLKVGADLAKSMAGSQEMHCTLPIKDIFSKLSEVLPHELHSCQLLWKVTNCICCGTSWKIRRHSVRAGCDEPAICCACSTYSKFCAPGVSANGDESVISWVSGALQQSGKSRWYQWHITRNNLLHWMPTLNHSNFYETLARQHIVDSISYVRNFEQLPTQARLC